MTPNSAILPYLDASSEPPKLAWRSWPLRDGWMHWWLPLTGVVGIFALAGIVTGRLSEAALAGIVILLALSRGLIATRFELNSAGVWYTRLRRTHRIPWHAIVRCQILHEGLLLLPDREPGGSARLRGLYVPWNQHRQTVGAIVEYYLGGHVPSRPDEPTTLSLPSL